MTTKPDTSITASLQLLEKMLDEGSDRIVEMEYFDTFGTELRRLHARIRIHDAVKPLQGDNGGFGPSSALPPELVEEMNQLRGEHPMIIGQLDRLIRLAESMADRPVEDKDLFVMRARELIAVLRRHQAEEDRLFYLAVWRDTGGES